MPIIIGICGKKFNGKDTFADYFVNEHGFKKVSFGDSVKHSLQNIFGFSDNQLWGNEKETVDQYWNVSPREMMQFFGTELMRIQLGDKFKNIGQNIWVMSLERKLTDLLAKGYKKIIIPDIRFANEAEVIRKFNGTMIRIIRENVNSSDAHTSENSSDEIVVDHTVENKTLDCLRDSCCKLYSNLLDTSKDVIPYIGVWD